MGLLNSCVIFLTLLAWIHLVYSTVSCPSGDTPGTIKNGSTCSQLIATTNYECYNATIETSCCASCNTIATGISGCQYGDRVDSCALGACPFYSPGECCFTCRVTTTIETITTTMTPSPAGNTTNSLSQSPSVATTTPSTALNNTTSSFIQSVSTATTTITSSTAENNITSFASQSSASESTSAGVIAGSVVGSLAGTGLIAGATYAGVQFFKR
ncbi:hypothetical protein ACJMK2_015116 [Sinanodonta woodiana]|uniref:Uncharacterized protein n=1 Tax=Sinanodonta woodiana TaxID=1069815 RepID=A0ABD3V2N6_SINWO